jgi:AbrB family looped-hinge helix DNA binding protein
MMPGKITDVVAHVLLEIDGMSVKVSRVTQRGRIVIPTELRQRLGIHGGTAVIFLEKHGRVILRPITKKYVAKLRGMLKGEPSVLKTLLREPSR